MALLIAATLVSFKVKGPSTWALDQPHSQLRFSVDLFGISDIQGTFKMKVAVINASKDDFSDAVVSMTADINSIDTDNDDRDKHLRTADYFDGTKYPDITFSSTSFKKIGEGKYQVTGNLSFHGITKSVTLEAVAKETEHPMTKKALTGFRVNGTIKRSDFAIATTTPSAMLSDNVAINANLQFVKN